MKLQPASKKELTFIAKGTVICTLVMLAVFLVLSVTGVYPFSWRVPLAAAGGGAVAVANFYLLCLTVQSAAGMDDQKALKAKVQALFQRGGGGHSAAVPQHPHLSPAGCR